MIARSSEQRNLYKGSPPRPWVRLSLISLDGTIHDVELLVDTGNPFAIIISQANMAWLKQGDFPDTSTNFGTLEGGWLHVDIPEVGLDQDIVAYASDAVVTAAKASSPDFGGLAGLPLLRMFEYGGDANCFWISGTQTLS